MTRFYVQWHILDRCDLRCRHCYQEDFSAERELDWPDLQRIAENLLQTMEKWDALLDVAVTGGEPLLKKETFTLLHFLDRHRRTGDLSLITNGMRLECHLEKLKGLHRLKDIRVSLDGASAETNDRIRGRGSFEAVCRQIELAAQAGIPVFLMFTAMKSNRGEAAKLIPLAQILGASGVIVERFFPLGQGKALPEEVLSGEEFLGLWQAILERAGCPASPAELVAYRGIKVVFAGKSMDVFGSGCILGRDGGAVMPDGSFFPCRRFPLAAGSLLQQPLGEIWKTSPLLQVLRDKRKLKGRCGACLREGCTGCRAMCHALSGDFLAEDPHCWLVQKSYL